MGILIVVGLVFLLVGALCALATRHRWRLHQKGWSIVFGVLTVFAALMLFLDVQAMLITH